MKKIVKQIVGIDVSQDELVVCVGRMCDDWSPELIVTKTFTNTTPGFEELVSWVAKKTEKEIAVRFVMEATGVYHEALAYFLSQNDRLLSIVLPNKISNYMRTLQTKTITDKTACRAIAQFGLERNLEDWHRPKKVYKKFRQLTRERSQLVEERTMIKNQLHAEQTEVDSSKDSIKRMKVRIDLLDKQEKQIEAELKNLVETDAETEKLVRLLCSIPGVAMLTAAAVLGETNGFDLIRNRRQLASYAGLDVQEKQSGTSVKGKARISKKGNKYLRRSLYMPALAAIRSDERFKAIFARLVSKHGIKMKAAVAVQRKLLELMYTLYKTNKKYDKTFIKTNQLVQKKLERSV